MKIKPKMISLSQEKFAVLSDKIAKNSDYKYVPEYLKTHTLKEITMATVEELKNYYDKNCKEE